jgi:hypothetical protein
MAATIWMPKGTSPVILATFTVMNSTDEFISARGNGFSGAVSIDDVRDARWGLDNIKVTTPNALAPTLLTLAPHQMATVQIFATVLVSQQEEAELMRRFRGESGKVPTITVTTYEPDMSDEGELALEDGAPPNPEPH